MTEKEFVALLNVEGKQLDVYQYEKSFWIGQITDKQTGDKDYSFAGDTRDDTIGLLAYKYYANNRK
jgi:hypothetical protein